MDVAAKLPEMGDETKGVSARS